MVGPDGPGRAPSIAFAEEVVFASSAARTGGRGDGQWPLDEIFVGAREHAGPLDGGEVEREGGSGGAHRWQGELGNEESAASHANASLARGAFRGHLCG